MVDNFDYDVNRDEMVCSEGKRSTGSFSQDGGRVYYFSEMDCQICKMRGKCLSRTETRKRVYLSSMKKRKMIKGDAGRRFRKKRYGERWMIE